MSAKQLTGVFAIAILIALIGPSGAQDAGAALDAAKAASPALVENAWDFTNPNSIPGFGTLPQGYDARSVLPKFSGE